APTLMRHPLPTILAASAAALLCSTNSAKGAILDSYTFGADGTTPSVLTPSAVDLNVTASSITAGAGMIFDLSNTQGPLPPNAPYLRTTFTVTGTTPAAAITN